MSKIDLQRIQIGPIPMDKAIKLVENSEMVKSVYIDFQQLKNWLDTFDPSDYPNIGFRCYFAKYGSTIDESPNPDYDNQPTLVLRAMYNPDNNDPLGLGKHAKKIPHPHSSISVVANLGGLCPPDCGKDGDGIE